MACFFAFFTLFHLSLTFFRAEVPFKVSNDLDNYLLRHIIFKDCLASDVHHMTSQILSILIDFIQDLAFFLPFFRSFLKSLNLDNYGTREDIGKR